MMAVTSSDFSMEVWRIYRYWDSNVHTKLFNILNTKISINTYVADTTSAGNKSAAITLSPCI